MEEIPADGVRAAAGAAALWGGAPGVDAPAVLEAEGLALVTEPPAAWPAHLPAPRRAELAVHAAAVAAWLAAHRARRSAPVVLAVNGGQGSGKSTLAALVAAQLEGRRGLRAAVLSLDDLYLPRAEREALARTVHPLFATRGVPGTHDPVLGLRVLEALTDGAGTVAVPAFDKARDDRLPEAAWPRIEAPVDVVLFEGWCVGAHPEPEAALDAPVNALEREEDPDGRWRRAVNAALAGPYRPLFDRADALLVLRVPDFDAVRRWREEQERELRSRTGAGMDPQAVQRFVDHYERLTRHMLATLPERAELCLELAPDHGIARVRAAAP
jgi:D-glycerate 3-kinase